MPYLEREDNPWEEVMMLNPSSRKRTKGGKKVAKRGRKGRKGRKGRRRAGYKGFHKMRVTVQGGGLLAVGKRRRIRGIRVVGKHFGRKGRKRSRRRRGGRKGRKGSRRGRKRHYSMGPKRRAHWRKKASKMARAGKLREVGKLPKGFQILDNPHRGGGRMARRRRRGRRHDNPKRRRRSRRGRRRYRKSSRRHRRSRRHSRRRHRRYSNPGKKRRRGRRRGHKRTRSFFLLARRSNPLGSLLNFPFKEAAYNGAIAGAGLLGVNWLFNSGPAFITNLAGEKGTVQHALVKNGVTFLAGMLVYNFTKFKPAGLALSTVAVANAVKEVVPTFLPEGELKASLGDLGLTYSSFEEVPSGAMPPPSLFQGLGSDIVYGSAAPYGSGNEGMMGLGDSNFVLDSAKPYGSGMEAYEEELVEA